jgi:hypothetical protein
LSKKRANVQIIVRLTVGVVVNEVEAITVENGTKMRLRNRKTDSRGDALAKRTGGKFNT